MEKRIKEYICSTYGVALADVDELFELGRKNICETLERLVSAIHAGNAETVVESAHMLKGTLYNMGLSELGDLARQIELEAKDGTVVGAEERYVQIRTTLGDVAIFSG